MIRNRGFNKQKRRHNNCGNRFSQNPVGSGLSAFQAPVFKALCEKIVTICKPFIWEDLLYPAPARFFTGLMFLVRPVILRKT